VNPVKVRLNQNSSLLRVHFTQSQEISREILEVYALNLNNLSQNFLVKLLYCSICIKIKGYEGFFHEGFIHHFQENYSLALGIYWLH
jgi:hypothetical protein